MVKQLLVQILNMMKKIYDINHTEFVHDERRNNIRTLSPNDNFNKKIKNHMKSHLFLGFFM